jgi:nicotinamide-nucleotide adenylyltransferase
MIGQTFDAAIVGRFQPFHNGHLKAVLSILKNESNLLIIIGSSQESGTDKNPFDYRTRERMIEQTLNELNVERSSYKIIPLPDINDDSKWVQYLIDSVPKFKVMYTGSDETKNLFLKYSEIPVKRVEFLDGVTGTLVRQKIQSGESVEKLVPNCVYHLLD